MKVSKTIIPSDWMVEKSSQKIMQTLNRDNSDPQALFVGGCVRNLLLGIKSKDIDIATKFRPEKVKDLCEAAGFKVIPTGIDHGTVTVIIDGNAFEVTTLRRDVETDGRRATIAYSDTWEEDAARRDFTFNTLLADMNGNIYDPTGLGIEDLENRQVKFVGNPKTRIREDYLRILRFFRFHSLYGRNEPDAIALNACKQLSDNIPNLSRERISQEFFKIIQSDNAVKVLNIMKNNGVMNIVFPKNMVSLSYLVEQQKKYCFENIDARLFVFFETSLDRIEKFSKTYFIFTNKQKKVFQKFTALSASHNKEKHPKDVIYQYGKDVATQYFLMTYEAEKLEDTMSLIKDWRIPIFPITGDDLKTMGLSTGPKIGDTLADIKKWWQSNGYQPNKTECLKKAKDLLG